MWDKAVADCRQAGTKAMTHSAYREAVTYFEQALGALPRLPARPDTQAQAIDLRLDLRRALYPLGELSGSCLLAGSRRPSPRPWAITTGWEGLCLSVTPFYAGRRTDRALAAGQRALAIATAWGRSASRSRRSTTWGLSTAAGGLSSGGGVFRKNVASLHGEQLHERFGMPGLASVVSRSLLA